MFNVFTATFGQFNAFMLNRSINFFQKVLLTPNLLNTKDFLYSFLSFFSLVLGRYGGGENRRSCVQDWCWRRFCVFCTGTPTFL